MVPRDVLPLNAIGVVSYLALWCLWAGPTRGDEDSDTGVKEGRSHSRQMKRSSRSRKVGDSSHLSM